MDETEFFQGMQTEREGDETLVAGAEHLLRLKKQVGLENRKYEDLELEKSSGVASDLLLNSVTEGGGGALVGGGLFGRGGAIIGGGLGLLHGVNSTGNHHQLLNEIKKQQPKGKAGHEKDAGELSGLLASTPPSSRNCPTCKKEKDACLCKMASILSKAREKTATALSGLKNTMSSNPTLRAATLGGVTSGAVGAATGAATSPNDPVGGALKGGWTGAASGASGGALYHHLNSKLAEARQKTASALVERLKDINPGLIASTGLGALVGGVGTYLASKPQKDTGKGRAEEELEGMVQAQKSQPERGLLSKMHHRNTELEHGYSRAFREHPLGAAAIGTASGAALGYGIGRLAGAATRMRGR